MTGVQTCALPICRGPDLPLENGTPAKAKVEVERRPALSFVLPFLRWLGGAEK